MIKLQQISAIVMLAVGVVFAAIGFWTPPVGRIHDSVLWLFAQCLIYTGSVLGVGSYVQQMHREIREKLDRQE